MLLVSISAASVLVWNATRNRRPAERGSKDTISPTEMLGSSKSKAIGKELFDYEPENAVDANILVPSSKSALVLDADEAIDIIDGSIFSKVTDEEVKRTRDMMMLGSKSGRVMSDEEIRKMLENQKKPRKLMPSSKSIDAILRPDDVKEVIEGSGAEKKQAPLMHSSKVSSAILRAKDVEEIIEPEKRDPHAKQEVPPQEDPFAPSEEKAK